MSDFEFYPLAFLFAVFLVMLLGWTLPYSVYGFFGVAAVCGFVGFRAWRDGK